MHSERRLRNGTQSSVAQALEHRTGRAQNAVDQAMVGLFRRKSQEGMATEERAADDDKRNERKKAKKVRRAEGGDKDFVPVVRLERVARNEITRAE